MSLQGINIFNNPYMPSNIKFQYTQDQSFGLNPFAFPMMPMQTPFMMPYIPMFPMRLFNIGGITTPAKSSATSGTKQSLASATSQGMTDTSAIKGTILSGKGKGSAYGPEFLQKVKEVAQRLNCNYRDLLAIMNSESGINANLVAKNGATGLIMFMPRYFNTAKIKNMTPIQQLDLVQETILNAKKRAGLTGKLSKGDLYALVFLPARAGNNVLCRRGESGRYYESNSALDVNHDGAITKDEMAVRINKKYVSDQTFLA